MECIRQTPNGSGDSQTVTISRNGDLIGKTYIEFTYNTSYKSSVDASGRWGSTSAGNRAYSN